MAKTIALVLCVAWLMGCRAETTVSAISPLASPITTPTAVPASAGMTPTPTATSIPVQLTPLAERPPSALTDVQWYATYWLTDTIDALPSGSMSLKGPLSYNLATGPITMPAPWCINWWASVRLQPGSYALTAEAGSPVKAWINQAEHLDADPYGVTTLFVVNGGDHFVQVHQCATLTNAGWLDFDLIKVADYTE